MRLKLRKHLCIIIAISIIISAFSACNQKESVSSSGSISFTDALGRNISLSERPQRVAALLGSLGDIWVCAGGSLCALPEDGFSDFGLDFPDAVNIGGAHSPDLEMLLSAQPDFIIASASTTADLDMKTTLEKLNITTAYFDIDSFEDYLQMLDICTDITGRKDLFEKNGLELKRRIDIIISQSPAKKLPEKERKILFLRASSAFIKVKGSEGTILGEMLRDMGLINIADSNSSLLEGLSAESIIACEPYRIFIVTMGESTEKAKQNIQKLIKENPAWAQLEAVKENRIHFMEKELFNLKPNARWADAYEKLNKILQ